MNKEMLPRVKSLGQLRQLANGEGEQAERYARLAMIAASNLGGRPKNIDSAMRHLNNEADATDSEEGVIGEVNSVRDIEANED